MALYEGNCTFTILEVSCKVGRAIGYPHYPKCHMMITPVIVGFDGCSSIFLSSVCVKFVPLRKACAPEKRKACAPELILPGRFLSVLHNSWWIPCSSGRLYFRRVCFEHGEYAYTVNMNEKSDIYSFGVVILELVTGRQTIDPEFGENKDLIKWVYNNIEKKNGLHKLLDPALVGCFKEEMVMVLKIGLLNTNALPIDRPSMRRVVEMLQEANPQHKGKATAKDGK